MQKKTCIAVVSPFIDKSHGTERCVAELLDHLVQDYQIHIYSKRVEDVKLQDENMVWHRIPDVPGPHLLRYLWWFAANHLSRWWHKLFRGLSYELVYTPGINCLNADVSIVHLVFHQYHRLVRDELSLWKNPIKIWPRLVHRKLYYSLIKILERLIYSNSKLTLGAVSTLTAGEIKRFFGREDVHVIPNAIDINLFNPRNRKKNRHRARNKFNLNDKQFALLTIGNDWKKKGLPTLLKAMGKLQSLPMKLLAVGREDPAPYEALIHELGIHDKVLFPEPSPRVLLFYSAADMYVGPSLHDSFALPPIEAMACGLPVITSVKNGGAEIITEGVDGIVQQDPNDSEQLAEKIYQIYADEELREQLSQNAVETARQYTWKKRGEQIREIFEHVLKKKHSKGTSLEA